MTSKPINSTVNIGINTIPRRRRKKSGIWQTRASIIKGLIARRSAKTMRAPKRDKNEKSTVIVRKKSIWTINLKGSRKYTKYFKIFTYFLFWKNVLDFRKLLSDLELLQKEFLFSTRVWTEFSPTTVAKCSPTFTVYVFASLLLLNPHPTFRALLIVHLLHALVKVIQNTSTLMENF